VTVSVRTKGKIVLDVNAALDFVATQAVGIIQRRTAKGIDSSGQPFAQYSHEYAAELLAAGENTNVDLTRSGAYLAGISERSRTVTAAHASVVIGPGTGSSPGPNGQRSPPHPVLGAILENGRGRLPARRHLGLTPEERKRLAEKVSKIVIKQG
jgi:hypothetical protein